MPRSRKNKKDFGGRLFHRVKKQAHYPISPSGPKLLACPVMLPSPHKTKGNKEGAGQKTEK